MNDYPWCDQCEEAPFGVPREVTQDTVMKKVCCGTEITLNDWQALKIRLRADLAMK